MSKLIEVSDEEIEAIQFPIVNGYRDEEDEEYHLINAVVERYEAAALNAEPAGLTPRQRELIEELKESKQELATECEHAARTCATDEGAYAAQGRQDQHEADVAELTAILARSAPASGTEERNTPDTN